MPLHMTVLSDRLAVCRLPAGAALPAWAMTGELRSVSWTAGETSVVCRESAVLTGVQAERGWRALRVLGPLPFDLTGVLASIAQPLADAGVSLFALSTFDTDYVLVKEESLDRAIRALVERGHHVTTGDDGAV